MQIQSPYWLMSAGLDPDYFSPLEAAYAFHGTIGKSVNKKIDDHFRVMNFRNPIVPSSSVSGFIFANRDEGTKAFVRRGWLPAEQTHGKAVWKTIKSFLFGTRYRYSPVSPLYLYGRQQDFAAQKPPILSINVTTCGRGSVQYATRANGFGSVKSAGISVYALPLKPDHPSPTK